jgi:hypothetical protein
MPDINYVLNDPSTPNLVMPVDLPPKPNGMEFKVDGFRGATPTMYTQEHQAALCHYNLVQGINVMRKYLKNPILNHWAATQSLYIQPRAGKQLNAYYDRQALRFFYATDPITKNMVYAVNSADVVLHELGHALLDALRPDLFNVQAYEVWGFHEAFGDINAIANALQHDELIDIILVETGGNLAQSNTVTKLAEEMGRAIFNLTGGRMGHTAASLRNAYNNFTYVIPEKLPRHGMDNQLSSEPHSFSRVFTGVWYDILCSLYEAQRKVCLDAKTALKNARDILISYTFNAIPNAPATIRFYDAVAKAMLVQDKLNGYMYNQIMNDAFIKRGILRQAIRPMAAVDWAAFKTMVEPQDQVIEDAAVMAVRTKSIELLTLPDFMVNVEVPNDSYYEFDSSGNCVENIVASPGELIDHARDCVDFLKEKGFIRSDRLTPFEITPEGNLVRTHFAGCFLNNCTNPNQIEYLKCWKPENNAGCGCGGKKKPECVQKGITSVTVANTRLSVSSCGFGKTSSEQNVTFSFSNSVKSKTVC